MKAVFFVSDEGSGHKVRESCVANELVQAGVDVVFQAGNIGFVKDLMDPRVEIRESSNLIELTKGPLGVDIDGTLIRLRNYESRSRKWIEEMTRSKHVLGSDILVTDIVEEAGEVARRTGKPILAISHFTWHWFFEKLDPRFSDISSYLKGCFAVDTFLYPPFSKEPEGFLNGRPVRIIARGARRPRAVVREELHIQEKERVVLVASGEKMIQHGLRYAMPTLKKTDVVYISNSHLGQPFKLLPDGARFNEYVNAADLVITKGGYSTLSECLAYGTAIMIVREQNHPETRENAKLLNEANRAFVCDFEDFQGNPRELILQALGSPIERTPLDNLGQRQAREIILETLNRL